MTARRLLPVLGISAAVGTYCGVDPPEAPQSLPPTSSITQKVTACSAAALIADIKTANMTAGAQTITLSPKMD